MHVTDSGSVEKDDESFETLTDCEDTANRTGKVDTQESDN